MVTDRLRTAREKMAAGEWYSFWDDELGALRAAAQDALHEHNTLPPSKRGDIAPALAAILGGVGERCRIEQPFHCSYGVNIFMADGAYMNFGCVILDQGRVTIGRNAMIGPRVQIYTVEHHKDPAPRNDGMEIARPVTIGDNVWIGGGAIILGGVTIGDGAIVAAGAVVTRAVAAGTTVAGNPARAR
jgi:maltose O-acetyltransferase